MTSTRRSVQLMCSGSTTRTSPRWWCLARDSSLMMASFLWSARRLEMTTSLAQLKMMGTWDLRKVAIFQEPTQIFLQFQRRTKEIFLGKRERIFGSYQRLKTNKESRI